VKTKIHISDKFSGLSDFISDLPKNYDRVGELIYNGRNEVRTVKVNGLVLVIKYFKRMTLANRFIYAMFRKTKAQRAFEYAAWLLDKGITSPENVAYVDCYEHSMLVKSFFVNIYTDYKPIKDLFALSISDSEEGLKAFARFTYQLHRKGVFHYDYSVSNILFSNNDGVYDFALIDNNRMKISKYSFRRGIKTLNRLAIPVERMGIVAAEYARVSGVNDLEMLNAMVLIRLLHQLRNVIKQWLKAPIRYLIR
jgi:tRNA A-37 threonylcarbamoyl transferase component Bud32